MLVRRILASVITTIAIAGINRLVARFILNKKND